MFSILVGFLFGVPVGFIVGPFSSIGELILVVLVAVIFLLIGIAVRERGCGTASLYAGLYLGAIVTISLLGWRAWILSLVARRTQFDMIPAPGDI